MKIPTKILEKRLKKPLKRQHISLGVDTASRTGWATVKTGSVSTIIEVGFIDVKSKSTYFKFDRMIETFSHLLRLIQEPNYDKDVIIEDVFFGRNVHTTKLLARIGMIVYVLSKLSGLPKQFLLATQARSKLGMKTNVKKHIVHEQLEKKLKLGIKDEDAVDAVILALSGAIKEETLWEEKRK
jgi:Holliday junction resolvasome RuvABC endonuclease subunit